jgi:hypothetical protein
MAYYRRILILTISTLALIYLFFAIQQILEPKQVVTEQDLRSDRRVQTHFGGTEQEVTVYHFSGREKGPTLLIIGGIHGDEAAGYLTADRYINIELKRGNLIVIPRLNLPAIRKGQRHGLDGDMNRLFHLHENKDSLRDSKVVNLAKSLIMKADCVLNLHQADGFYSPKWVSRKRNPSKWGQCNVIDAPTFDLPNGEKLELERFARAVAVRSNGRIGDSRYHFQVNNTNTGEIKSQHKEQRMSLTYYALSQQHKIALGLEATKNCSLSGAVSFLTIVINSVMDEMGISAVQIPSESLSEISRGITEKDRT